MTRGRTRELAPAVRRVFELAAAGGEAAPAAAPAGLADQGRIPPRTFAFNGPTAQASVAVADLHHALAGTPVPVLAR